MIIYYNLDRVWPTVLYVCAIKTQQFCFKELTGETRPRSINGRKIFQGYNFL